MAPSLNLRPRTGERPPTRDQSQTDNLVIPSRTSSLHSRITQPLPTTLALKPGQRTPKTLTHAYMVCGVGREPTQWVKAPAPSQGKIQHMKGAIGQFWLPEILGQQPAPRAGPRDCSFAPRRHEGKSARTTAGMKPACFRPNR